MNTRTNTLWCKSLAMLALTFALAGTALGQITIQWNNPADITYGTILDGTQLNATAVDANGNAVAGTFQYSWNPPTPPAGARDGEDNPAVDGVTINVRRLTLQQILDSDADSTVNGTQANPDWRFLDVGDNQQLNVLFTPDQGIAPLPKTVQINVKPKSLTIFPRALERNFGEENYPGWEFGRDPKYPNGEDLRDEGNNNVLLSNDNDGNAATVGAPVQKNGATVPIASINPDAGNGYAATGAGLFFDGFVRGETYNNLATQAASVAAAGEVLVTTFFRLNVKDGNNNDIFRAAPVGTSGTVTFATNPAFKNYSVNIGGSGSLTVKKALIEIKAATLKNENNVDARKTFGETLQLADGQGRPVQGILQTQLPLPLNNDFRLGEASIIDFVTASSSGAAATANVGSYPITLAETPPQNFDVSILRNNYDLRLVAGTVDVKARNIQFTAFPSNPPAGFSPSNTSGFNFKLYGDSAQPPTFAVLNPAPHHLKDNQLNNFYDDPRTTGAGNGPIANTYLISQIKAEAFQSLPTVAHTVEFQSVPGNYAINISGGAGSNYNITHRNAGTFEVRRAYVVIQAENASSFLGAGQSTIPLSLHGVRSFDQVLNADGSLNVNATLDKILISGTPKPATGIVGGFNANPAGPNFPVNSVIQFTNIPNVRANNYDLYFNDGTGARNFLNNNTRVAVDANGNAAANGRGFGNFLFNIFNAAVDQGGFTDDRNNANNPTDDPNNPGQKLAHALYRAGTGTIGQYSVDVIRAQVSWPAQAQMTFGSDLTAGRLNATILHPDTRLPLDDSRNVPSLDNGTDYFLIYSLIPDGQAAVVVQSNDPNNPVALDADSTRLLKAGKIHKLKVNMVLTNAGQTKVQNANRQASEFTAAGTENSLAVVARTIKVTPRENGQDAGKANNPFNTAIPTTARNNGFWDLVFEQTGDLTAAQRDAEIKFNDVKIQVLDSSGNAIAPGTTNTPRGAYTIRLSGFAAQNGNVAFNLIDGTYTITPIPVVIAWENNLPTITYGDTVPVAGVKDATITTANVPTADGQIVYTPDPETTSLVPDVAGQKIKAQWKPNDEATSNFSKSNEIELTVGVNKKAITVQVQSIDKVFGEDTVARSLVTPINDLLVAKDNGKVTVGFDVQGNGADKKAAVGEYTISPTFTDDDSRLANYAVTIQNSRVKVTKRVVNVTPVSRSMEVGENATDFVDNWEVAPNLARKPNDIVIFDNLASFHALGNDRTKFNTRFPTFELLTDSPSLPSVGQVFNINVQTLGVTGAQIDGAAIDGTNYDYKLQNNVAKLTVVEKKVDIAWNGGNNINIVYGQAIGRSGEAIGNTADGATKAIKALSAGSTTPLDGDIAYTFSDATTDANGNSFAAGDTVPDGTVLRAGNTKIKATAKPASSQANFAENTVERTIVVAKRPLNIRILDRTNQYGSVDLFFQAEYGLLRNGNEANDAYANRVKASQNKLVNGDTPENLDQQLVLFTNAQANSGAGDYFIAVAQTAEDSNYDIRPVFGSQTLFDGIVRDGNQQVLVNVGTNFRPNGTNGTGTRFSFVTDQGNIFNPMPANGDNGNDPGFTADIDNSGNNNGVLDVELVNVFRNGNDPDGAGAGLHNDAPVITGFVESYAGKLTITRAPLTIKASDLTKDQGQPNPPFAAEVPDATQLQNGDTLETLLATPVRFTSSVGTDTAVGTFPITAFGGSSANYIVTHAGGTFTVAAPPVVIGWTPNPSSIVYGTALGADQLNATSTVAGTFDYSANAAGTVLNAGTRTLSVTFTPADLTANRVTTATAELRVDPGTLTVTANDVNRGFLDTNPDFTVSIDGFVNGDDATVLGAPVTFTTDGVNGANAGSYPLTPAGATANNYNVSFVAGTITIAKAPAQVSLGNLSQAADGTPRMVTVNTVPEGLTVDLTYNGSADAPSAPGTYGIRALVNDVNYIGFATGELSVSGSATVSFADLDQVFDGSPKVATITTEPAGLATTVTYSGSSNPPVNAGSHEIRVLINDPNYTGFGVAVLNIAPASARVLFDFDTLSQPINQLTGAVVTTEPAGLNTEIFYGETTSLPTELGSVGIRAVINEPNYVGSASSSFLVQKAAQTITTFPLPDFTMNGAPLNIALIASASSNLPVTFSVASGQATVNGSTVVVTQPGSIVVQATQAGDDFWAPAQATITISVTGQGVPLAPPSLSIAGVSSAGIEIAVSGAAGANVNVMSTDTLPGGTFSSVGTVTLDGDGNGSITVPASGSAGFFKAENQ